MALNRNDADSRKEPERDPALERVYALGGREEPPTRLDDAIRAAARREVRARPLLHRKTWRWHLPVSLAAVLMLSVSLVTLMREEGADQFDASPPAAVPASPAVVPPAPPVALPQAQPDAPPPQAAPAPPPAPQAQERAAMPREADSGPIARPVPQGEGMAKRSDSGATPAAPAPEARRALKSVESGGIAPALRAPAWSGFERQPPEKWIDRIEELRRAGHEVEAREMLDEFRKRFPEHPLPAALAR